MQQKYDEPRHIGKLVSEEELATFEPGLSSKISEMLTEKQAAADDDDFDRLVTLRDAVIFLRDKGRKFKQYMEMKALAIENEDYEVAKRLKTQIEAERRQMDKGYGIDSRTGQVFAKSENYRDMSINQSAATQSKRQLPLEQSLEQVAEAIEQQQDLPQSSLP